tara:strand:+ start:488 stop:715 length:228 start_codon:yes stop_codon:yes gene_type:complete
MPQLNTESPTYMQDTLSRISLALGYDGESNQQCWDWIYAVSDRYGNDGLDERMDIFLKYYDNTGYLACSKEFRKK